MEDLSDMSTKGARRTRRAKFDLSNWARGELQMPYMEYMVVKTCCSSSERLLADTAGNSKKLVASLEPAITNFYTNLAQANIN